MNVPKKMYRDNAPIGTPAEIPVPTGMRWVVTNVVVCNNDATRMPAVTISFGGFVVLANAVIEPGVTLVLDIKQVLEPAETLRVSANTPGATVHVSGVELTI